MSANIPLIILVLALSCLVDCHKGVDISQLYSQSVYQCFKEHNFTFAIPRAFHSYGSIDANVVANLQNAKAAGLSADVYLFPCRSKSPVSQVNELFSSVSSNLYGMVWIDVETNPSPGCGWGSDFASNCAFVKQMSQAIKAKGKKVGFYTVTYFWRNIMGSVDACKQVASDALWYAHYDKNEDYKDYVEIGGWKKPSLKQYVGDTTLCGASVDLNYHE